MATALIKYLLRSTENYVELIVVLHAYRYFNISVNTDYEMLTVPSMLLDVAEILEDAKTGVPIDEGKTVSPTFGIRLSEDFDGTGKYNGYFVKAFDRVVTGVRVHHEYRDQRAQRHDTDHGARKTGLPRHRSFQKRILCTTSHPP